MSLDTRYRPLTYDDVLGQAATIQLLRSLVINGTGHQQSYLFGGSHGSGKTSIGRILARALLCLAPVEGAPCDKCTSCLGILNTGGSINFTEVDAATNSGKDDVRRITQEIEYASFDGGKKLYLFDECFTEDTVLLTPEGPRKIFDIVESRQTCKVWARDLTTGEDGWADVSDWFDHGERDVWEMDFGDGLVLKVTDGQLFHTSNRGWVPAEELTCDDDVIMIESPV